MKSGTSTSPGWNRAVPYSTRSAGTESPFRHRKVFCSSWLTLMLTPFLLSSPSKMAASRQPARPWASSESVRFTSSSTSLTRLGASRLSVTRSRLPSFSPSRANGISPSGMEIGPSPSTTLLTLAMPLRTMETPIIPTTKMPRAPSRILSQ